LIGSVVSSDTINLKILTKLLTIEKMDNLDEYKDLLPPEDNPDDHHENGNGSKK